MNIELHEVLIKDLAENYKDAGEKGVTGYNGRLNIRPAYQREFVYKDKQRSAVIETVKKDFPLNVMYWVKNSDDSFEVLDGQQRTISICEFIIDKFSMEFETNKTQYFGNLTDSEKEQILNYKLMVYFCEGDDKEKLDWFKTINIAGEKLYDQELRNAIYTGSWLADAKSYFSRNGCVASSLGKDYLTGSSIRQDYLQTTLSWINNGKIEEYMAQHQHDHTANELWTYFQSVITWVKSTFPNYRSVMKGVEWGTLYNEYKDKNLNPQTLEEKMSLLMLDDEVGNKKGIYFYVLDDEERHLNLRAFSEKVKRETYEKQKGKCANPKCPNSDKEFSFEEMEGDHIDPWSKGGKTITDNCQMLCKPCNRRKSGK